MRNLGLDLLRIVAVFLVLGRHLNLPSRAGQFLRIWQRGGWVGVDLFFVLSGFLVASLLFREFKRNEKIDLKRFLIRRGMKIYPAFWVFLIISMAVKIQQRLYPSTDEVLGEVLFLQNYLGGIWNHTWSLAVEEHFYLGIAVLFGLWGKFRPQWRFSAIPVTFLIVAITCLGIRILNSFLFPRYDHYIHLFATHIRIDSLFFGVLLSYLWLFHDLGTRIHRIPSAVLILVGLVLLSPAFIFELEKHLFIPTYGVILFYLGSGCILLAAIRLRESSSSVVRLFGVLGAASYSIYLWHMPVGSWGCRMVQKLTGNDSFELYMASYLIGSCVCGLVMSRLVEFPVLAIRDLLFPSEVVDKIGADSARTT